ncbi:MAG: hypothetical protein AB1757_00425 [Acidobacteriota bacterium]
MPTNILPHCPKIRVIASGMFISNIVDGSSQADIGLLRNAPNHRMNITLKIRNDKDPEKNQLIEISPDYHQDFSILVNRVTQPGIQVYRSDSLSQQPFNRRTLPDLNNVTSSDRPDMDFGWVVDLDDLLGRKCSAHLDPTELAPTIYFNKGIFYTGSVSLGRAFSVQGGQIDLFGHMAHTLAIDIELEHGVKAIFKNGSNVLYEFQASDPLNYLIEIDRDCIPDDICHSDFKLLYHALSLGLDEDHKVDLQPDPETDTASVSEGDPLIPCMGGNRAP